MKSSTRIGPRARAVLAAATGIFLASQAWADVAVCSGKVTSVANHMSCADVPNWHVSNTRYFYVGK